MDDNKEIKGLYISILQQDKLFFNDGGGGGGKGKGIIGGIEFGSCDDQKKKSSFRPPKTEAEWPPRQKLCKLMESRGAEAIVKLNDEFGGVSGLCQSLSVDQVRGLANEPSELAQRREKYGANSIPSTKAKSFWRLLFDACKDPTLIILVVAGFISLGLSFYGPGQGDGGVEVNGTLSNSTAELAPNGTNDPIALPLQKSEGMNNSSFSSSDPIRTNNSSSAKAPDKEPPVEEEEDESRWIEGVAILACVVVVVFVTAINDFSKERQFRSLQASIETGHKFSVVRDGEAIDVPVSDLVVGDVARVKYGDLIPADGILIQSNDLKVDESSLTGESDHVKKSIETDPVLLSGTYAMEGSAKMVIVAVGVYSQTGIIMTLLGGGKLHNDSSTDSSSSTDDTSSTSSSSDSGSSSSTNSDECSIHSKSILQAKLSALALRIIYCGTTIAVLALIVLVVRYCIDHFWLPHPVENVSHLHNFVKFFIIAVTILVISIPEGLPLAIALSLTYSVRKMMRDNNLVRHLDACETMGNATTICSDKTGTLTTNRMTVVQSFTCERHFGDEKSQPGAGDLPKGLVPLLSEAISVNCAYNSMIVEPKKPGERMQQLGNKTECALLGWVRQIGGDYEQVRRDHPEESLYKVYTFNSSRKMMMSVIQLFNSEGQNIGFRVFVKGASEILLSKCAFFLDAEGRPAEFNSDRRENLMSKVIHGMAGNGLRTITIGYKDYVLASIRAAQPTEVSIQSEQDIHWDDEQSVSEHLVGLAICGIQDPVRKEVPAAIEKCRRAGITVRMVTGDNVNTARAIAIQCGIFRPDEDYLVLEGKEFNNRVRDENGKIDQSRLDQVWPRLRVLARAQPADKYVLVKGIIDSKLNTQREIVAVTGDGTNDGPALKKADVGFAMGIAGTDVAKEASDIILTDDNFTSIVKAVMWGRNVYDSISKFLQFQLTVNIVAVFTAFVSACFIADSPLKAVHMLWLNLIMDTLASLALATEMPTEELLQRKPYGRKKSLISRTMIRNILCHGIYQFTILMVLLFKGPELLGIKDGKGAALFSEPTQHFTIIFNALVMMTLFNEINARKVHGERNVFKNLSSNWTFCIIWICTFIAQFLIVHFGGRLFSTARLNWSQWLLCLALGVSELLFGQIVATIPTKKLLPKWLALYRSIPERLHRHHGETGSLAMQKPPVNRGYALWLRGIELIGIHYRVCRNLHGSLIGRRVLDVTAPTMTAEVAEHWRQSYRRYRHRKNAEKKLRDGASGMGARQQSAPIVADDGGSKPLPKKSAERCKSTSMIQQQQPSLPHLAPNERRARRHLRALKRPASLENVEGGEDGQNQQRNHRPHHFKRRQRSEENRKEGEVSIPMEPMEGNDDQAKKS